MENKRKDNLIVSKFSDLLYIVIGISSYAVIAITFAYLLNTNFCSVLYNSFAPFEAIGTSCGDAVYLMFLFTLGILGTSTIYTIYTLINKNINK